MRQLFSNLTCEDQDMYASAINFAHGLLDFECYLRRDGLRLTVWADVPQL
jgi:hypothetical protein